MNRRANADSQPSTDVRAPETQMMKNPIMEAVLHLDDSQQLSRSMAMGLPGYDAARVSILQNLAASYQLRMPHATAKHLWSLVRLVNQAKQHSTSISEGASLGMLVIGVSGMGKSAAVKGKIDAVVQDAQSPSETGMFMYIRRRTTGPCLTGPNSLLLAAMREILVAPLSKQHLEILKPQAHQSRTSGEQGRRAGQ